MFMNGFLFTLGIFAALGCVAFVLAAISSY